MYGENRCSIEILKLHRESEIAQTRNSMELSEIPW